MALLVRINRALSGSRMKNTGVLFPPSSAFLGVNFIAKRARRVGTAAQSPATVEKRAIIGVFAPGQRLARVEGMSRDCPRAVRAPPCVTTRRNALTFCGTLLPGGRPQRSGPRFGGHESGCPAPVAAVCQPCLLVGVCCHCGRAWVAGAPRRPRDDVEIELSYVTISNRYRA